MAVIIGADALEGVLKMSEAVALLERMSWHEAAGRAFVSPRLTSGFEGGWMRMMFAADCEEGYAATKAFHMIRGVGVRYVVLLYRLMDGELLAVLDGRMITDLRTGAASGLAARYLRLPSSMTVGLLGSGHQARMQLEALASQLNVGAASVYSPNAQHRHAFAAEMTRRCGVAVTAVDTPEAAVCGHTVVVAATNAVGEEPVLRRHWLEACRLVCAVGSTRPQSIEVDERTFGDAELVIVDTLLAAEEAGDIRRAMKSGRLTLDRQITLAQLVARGQQELGGGYAVFKSVGTALQDLALAARCYELLRERPELPRANGLASLKQPISAQAAASAAKERIRKQ